MDSLGTTHMRLKPPGGPNYNQSKRDREIEKDNKTLFDKIEGIINRQGPYKLQPSKKNPKRLAKVYHVPSDHYIQAASYI